MRGLRRAGGLTAALVVVGTVLLAGTSISAAAPARSHAQVRAGRWAQEHQAGSRLFKEQVPLAVRNGAAQALRRHAPASQLTLNFSFPLRNTAALDRLIARQAKTHRYLSRAELYRRFSPPQAQVSALGAWLQVRGFRITHVGRDRLTLSARASTATIERALGTKIADYRHSGTRLQGLAVKPYVFFANTKPARLPARFGVTAISGLTDVSSRLFYTNYQLATGGKQGSKSAFVRGGGYFPGDLRGLYDVTGHGFDGTGQTIGFTLWTAPERQATMTAYASATNSGSDQPITVDPSCIATGNSPTAPSSCSTQTVAGDHLLNILENGNSDTNSNFGSNVETALDIESAHGVATHVGMKYYASECHGRDPGTGLADGGCNGSDVGMEMAMEDAANDPTLHSVSNSWGYGGEAEFGLADPFVISTNSILQLAAAAGTSFYFSTGDAGTYESGYPTDSPYVVSVGGTSTWSTSTTSTWSTSTTWSGGGSWCSGLFARPSWQTGAGVTATAPCPGRVSPDLSAIADPNTGVRFVSSNGLTGQTQSGQVGGTSLAAPVLNGLQAVTKNFVNAQTYPGATPQIGFLSPLLYQLGNSGHADSYYREVDCGNTANPTSGPDGEPATKGFDAATGWGEPDWFNFSTGIAQLLGATSVATPASLNRHFAWTCAKTPSNSSERAFACPSASTCYAVGASSGATPWYGKFLAAGAWGAVNTIFKSTNGGQSWFPSNSDMFSIACLNSANCITVGAGGRERLTQDGGDTWTDTPTAAGNNKPLTQIECPSSSICYAVGDRGNGMKSTDGGQTWNWLSTGDGNPLYGLSCPTTSVCYATDIYAHVIKTTNGGATWSAQITPVTTPQSTQVAETGGPNPFAGFTGVSCSDASTCAAVGFYATVSGQTPAGGNAPFVVTTTDGGTTWTRRVASSGTSYLAAIKCLPGTTTCFAVGRGGAIATTTDLATWTPMTSNTTNMLNSVYCSSTTSCIAVGQNGTVDVLSSGTWTATTGNGGTGMLADVACDGGNLVCYATGKQGVTLLSTTGGTSWTQKAGGGSQANQLNGIACTSTNTCYAAGAAGQLLKTTNGGQMWTTATSGTTAALNGISCFQANGCVAVGAVASGAATVRFTTDGTNWNTGLNTGTQALNGISCPSGGACLAVGAAGTAISTTAGGGSWDPTPTGTTNALNAVTCPSSVACYAVGAAGTILKFPNIASGPSPLTSGTTAALNGVACSNASACIADGNSLIIGTTNGSTFSVQGNPLGGPASAQNASGLALNGALCTASRCFVGAGAQGDILTAGTLTVTVHTSSVQGSTPNLTNLSPSNPAISYSPSSEAGNVTGTLTCSTTADSSSPVGNYPISNCSGLADDGFNVVYDYANSNHAVVGIVTTATLTPAAVNGWNFNPTTVTLTAVGQNTTIANTKYRVDSTGAFQLYTGPFSVSGGGTHTVDYFSTDTLGNVEPTRTTTFQIDTTPPTTTASVAPPSPTGLNGWYVTVPAVSLSATDAGLGVASTKYTIDGGPTQTYSGPFSLNTDGAHVIQYWSVDLGGNTEAPNSITVKVDLTNPTSSASISPTERNGWYAQPTVTLTGADGAGSGIDHISYKIDGEATWHTYTGPLSGFSTGNHFVQFQATDVAGRVEPTVNLIAFKADAVKPSVTITRPDDGAVYPLDKVVTAAYKCVDRESGMDTCVGTVANGANIDTSTVGDHTFTVTATDKSGNVTTVTNHYQVVYRFTGFFAPVTNTGDGLNLVHAGDLIKIGFGLDGDRGLTPFAAGFPTSESIACPSGTPHSVPAGGAGSEPGLQYGVSSGHYTYGWQTNSGWAGTCRRFELKLNDGTSTVHTADFMFFA